MTPGVYTQDIDLGLPKRPTIKARPQEVVPTVLPTSSIITDGLLLHLDAGNPASYPGSGTTWYDLSGNGYNATLINGPTYNSDSGSIVFSANFAKVTPFPSKFPTGSAARTLSAWFTISSYNIWLGAPIFGIGSNGYPGSRTQLYATSLGAEGNKVGIEAYNSARYTVDWPGRTAYNVWTNLTVVNEVASTVHVSKIYINGTQVDEASIRYGGNDASINTPNYSCTIGTLAEVENYQYNLNGSVGIALLYNRALSDSEILQNFNATKTRFGY